MSKIQTVNYQATLSYPADVVYDRIANDAAFERGLPPWRDLKFIKRENELVFLKVRYPFFWRRSWNFERKKNKEAKEVSSIQIEGPFTSFKIVQHVVPIDENSCILSNKYEYSLPFFYPKSALRKQLIKSIVYRHDMVSCDLKLFQGNPLPKLRILLSGSTGMIGKALLSIFESAGHEVVRLVRGDINTSLPNAIVWDPSNGKVKKEQFEGFDAVIHLAGENIACGRWTKKRKEKLFLSRCRDSWLLSEVLFHSNNPPKTFICASSIGFYGNRGMEELNEESPPGSGFLADLCVQWERATDGLKDKGVRVVHARFGAVLSPKGGFLRKMLLPFKLGLGGKLGSGKQIISWIAMDDLVGGIYHLLIKKEIQGPVNYVSPTPVSQEEFKQILAEKLGRPAFFTMSEGMLRLIFGEMAGEVILASAKVSPKRLLDSGYHFHYPRLGTALHHLL